MALAALMRPHPHREERLLWGREFPDSPCVMVTEILAARKPLAKEMGIGLWDKLNYRRVAV